MWIKNEELILKSSDFYEYEVDERVGILKTYREQAEGLQGQPSDFTLFSWESLENQKTCFGKTNAANKTI